MLSEAVVRKVIGVEGAEVLIGVIDGAWADHVAEGRLRTPWTRANIVWDYMETRAKDAFTDADGAREVVRHDRSMFVLRERFLLRFKKLTQELQTRNYPTPSQRELSGQGYFGDFLDLPTISCGYVLDSAQAGVESFVVVDNVDRWSIDLRELAAGMLTPVTSLLNYKEYEENLNTIPSITWPKASGSS
jgi:hypothetical protein